MGSKRTIADWLEAEPFALSMSSGFFGFFAHCGLMSVLEDRNILPSRVSGSSAGALIAGLWSAGLGAWEIRDLLVAGKREDFWDPHLGFGLLRGEKFRKLLRESLPIKDFSGCRVPLSLSVFSLPDLETRVLQEGPLVEAIYASCAVPGMFSPLKMDGSFCVDGGVRDRPGWQAFPDGERVFYHHLLSRSRWRRLTGIGWGLPESRANTLALAIRGLPKVGPFHLERGEAAFETARERFSMAFDQPLEGTGVII